MHTTVTLRRDQAGRPLPADQQPGPCVVVFPPHINADHIHMWMAEKGYGPAQGFMNFDNDIMPLPPPVVNQMTRDFGLRTMPTLHPQQFGMLAMHSIPLRLIPQFSGIDYSSVDNKDTLHTLAEHSRRFEQLKPAYEGLDVSPPLSNRAIPPTHGRTIAQHYYERELAKIANGGKLPEVSTNKRRERDNRPEDPMELVDTAIRQYESASLAGDLIPRQAKRARMDG